ncbi:YecR family lipoprotein [Candidatus Binatus sp.]|uniref:YecR family lipoprotein n=1 Tax=Candidatus Binatus sp. TaxID=2811406 RepID=UPI003C6F5955
MNFTPAIFACSLASLICLAGCAAQKEWAATGGSRADGTVELAYEYGAFEEPRGVNDEQGVELATATCGGWGYTASQAFGGTMHHCEAFGGYGNCLRTLVTRRYQCLGAPGVSVVPQGVPVALPPAQPNPAQPQTNLSANTGASGSDQRAPVAQGTSSVPGNATPAPNPNPNTGNNWHQSDEW